LIYLVPVAKLIWGKLTQISEDGEVVCFYRVS
jgi:hypothetical protein